MFNCGLGLNRGLAAPLALGCGTLGLGCGTLGYGLNCGLGLGLGCGALLC